MPKIKILPSSLVNKIAAGEVIERPASIVKELIENSIDARASEIEINVEEGGKKSIEIIDNGMGMSPEDAEKSFELHATSKIYTLEDLKNIGSFGFRGEALASVAAISEIIIHTKSEKEDGIEIVIENSELKEKKSKPRNIGTGIKVRDIFRHLPARKKFLKGESTEYRHILNEITKVALAYPEISFLLRHNHKEKINLKKKIHYSERILEIYPNLTKEDLIKINYDSNDININGYIIHPSALTKDRNKQYLYLNNRYIIEKSLWTAIKRGYNTTIPKELNPGYFINIKVDPNTIDINVHPRKLEAKIDNSSEIFRALSNTISSALDKRTKEDFQSKIKTIPTENEINQSFDGKYKYKTQEPKTTPIDDSQKFKYSTNRIDNKVGNRDIQKSINFSAELLNNKRPNSIIHDLIDENKFFQIFDTYIMYENNNELEIIDQHAADERVKFEEILEKLKSGQNIEQQNLLIPFTLDLSKEEIELLTPNLEIIREVGLDIDLFGENTIKINSVPQFAREVNYKELLFEILEEIRDNLGIGNKSRVELQGLNEKLAASLACHGSIRAGKRLNTIEIKKLIKDLKNCKTPYSCPHGRPIIWTLKRSEIEKQFKRIK